MSQETEQTGQMEKEKWRMLRRLLNADVPASAGQYIEPVHGCAAEIVRGILRDPVATPKYLLVGARGGGKSSELRKIAVDLDDHVNLITIDLDASGVTASSVSAFDLLYTCGLSLLRRIEDKQERESLFTELKRAYAAEEATQLGDVGTALAGLAQFATSASAAATGIGALVTAAGAPLTIEAAAVSGGIAVGTTILNALRLRGKPAGVVGETSPQGRTLQGACARIARACRLKDERPICILIDGLEKMNGQSGQRFREMFEETRLLADVPWAAVIAAPPCTLSETNALKDFEPQTVWGFGPEDLDRLELLIKLRAHEAGLAPDTAFEPAALTLLARMSGGLPRHAVLLAGKAVENLLDEPWVRRPSPLPASFEEALIALKALKKTPPPPAARPALRRCITVDDAQSAVRFLGERLALGLNEKDLETLARVGEKGVLPEDDAGARLFGDGRILAQRPLQGIRPRFVVHPLLQEDVARWKEQTSG